MEMSNRLMVIMDIISIILIFEQVLQGPVTGGNKSFHIIGGKIKVLSHIGNIMEHESLITQEMWKLQSC